MPTSYVEPSAGVPGFSPKYLKFCVTGARYRPEDKGRNDIPRLNSPLPNLKLGVPYGEYRATYVKGSFHPFSALVVGPVTYAHRANCGQPPSQASTPNASSNPSPDTQTTPAGQDPLKRPLSDKEKFKQQKELRNELKGPYKKWVDEDVRWIITDQELKAFKSLSNDEERDNFIETVLAAAQSRPRFP